MRHRENAAEGQRSRIRAALPFARPRENKEIDPSFMTQIKRPSEAEEGTGNSRTRRTLSKIGLSAGIGAIITAAIPLTVAIAQSKINLDKNTISSLLGKYGYLRDGIAATGLLGAAFGVGLRETLSRARSYAIETSAFVISSLALTVAALKPPPSPVHLPSAGTFFVGAALTIAAIGVNLWVQGRKLMGAFTVAASGAASAALAYGAYRGIHLSGLQEVWAGIADAVWIGVAAADGLIKKRI